MKVTPITLEVLTDTLAGSTNLETIDTSGMISHTIDHPTLGKCLTVQTDSNYLLITRL
jgi:hypothetical protein